jgi:hypothetical protein
MQRVSATSDEVATAEDAVLRFVMAMGRRFRARLAGGDPVRPVLPRLDAAG